MNVQANMWDEDGAVVGAHKASGKIRIREMRRRFAQIQCIRQISLQIYEAVAVLQSVCGDHKPAVNLGFWARLAELARAFDKWYAACCTEG